jgi:hypothetical protein
MTRSTSDLVTNRRLPNLTEAIRPELIQARIVQLLNLNTSAASSMLNSDSIPTLPEPLDNKIVQGYLNTCQLECMHLNIASINSCMKNEDNTLANISSPQAEAFLTNLANLREDGVQRFKGRFGKIIPYNFNPTSFRLELPEPDSAKPSRAVSIPSVVTIRGKLRAATGEEARESESRNLLTLRDRVRRVWTEPDLRTKQYGVFLLWKWAMFAWDDSNREIPTKLPPPSPFEQALQYLLSTALKQHYCANPDCAAPYFFAKRRSQRFCADGCAKPAQREFKRQWWAEHGEEWRASRKPKAGSKRGSKKGMK